MTDQMYFNNGEDVTVVKAGVKTDPYSDEPIGKDWNNTTETTVSFVAVGHGPSSEEYLAGRNPLEIALTLYMPSDADVTADDRVIVRGVTYAVYGQPFVWRSPFTGDTFGLEVPLQTVLG